MITYLCWNHFNALPGIGLHDEVQGKYCTLCGHEAEVLIRAITLTDEMLYRYIVQYYNNAYEDNKIRGRIEFENGATWNFDEDELGEHFCGNCHFPLTLVRPGKYQCETPWCASNQKEETE